MLSFLQWVHYWDAQSGILAYIQVFGHTISLLDDSFQIP